MTNISHIPDHSPAAISEGIDAALIRAAFAKMEAKEMKQYRDEIKSAAQPHPDHSATIRSLRRRVRARRTHEFLTHHLPRAAQLAACLIGILAIGTGVAFAASSAARAWAAGVLVGSAPPPEELEGFAAFGDHYEGFVDGATLGDAVCLLDQNNQTIRVLQSTDAEPALYQPAEPLNMTMRAMAANGGEVYLLCQKEPDFDYDANDYAGRTTVALEHVIFGEDGRYRLEAIFERSLNELLGISEDKSCYLEGSQAVFASGKLYFLTYIPSKGADSEIRLLAYDPASGEISKAALPEKIGPTLFDIIQLFTGPGGRLHLVRNAPAGNVLTNYVYRMEDDGSFARIGEVGGEAFGFVYRFDNDSIYYTENGSIYAAPGADFANAQRVGITTEQEGRGLIVGENGYMLVNLDHAKVFDLDTDVSGAVELVVDGDGGYSSGAADALNAENPNVTVRSESSYLHGADYTKVAESAPDGVDVWILDAYTYPYFRDAGHYVSIESDALSELVDGLYPGSEKIFRDSDGNLIAIPRRYHAYPDYTFNGELWAELGVAREELPDTWAEFLTLLIDLSHSEDAQKYFTFLESSTSEMDSAVYFARSIYLDMANSYGRVCSAQGLPADYSDENFRSLLDLFKQIDFSALRYHDPESGGSSEDSLIFLSSDYMLFNFMDDSPFVPMTLKFAESGPAVSRISGDFALIDPNSTHKAEAQRYLELIIEGLEDYERVLYLGEVPSTDEEEQEAYRRMLDAIGTVDTFTLYDRIDSERALSVTAAGAAYLKGEIDYAEYAARMNEIAGGAR